jgi:hypothetical protein
MGNGFTFPLQTLLFYSICLASCEVSRAPEFVSVFGDDCLVPVEVVPCLTEFACDIGWKMNSDKSYADGGFRESCGMDAYRGLGARPFFVERPDSTRKHATLRAWAYVCYNGVRSRLDALGKRHAHLDQWLTSFMDKICKGKPWRLHIVPPRYPESSGIRWGGPIGFPLPHYPTVQDVHGGTSFRYLRSVAMRQPVWEFPFFQLRIGGPSLSPDYVKCIFEVHDSLGLAVREGSSIVDSDGTTASKRSRYLSVKGYVHNWTYFSE